MAVIGKIREKSSLVMIIIGVGMLAFLLPTDGIQNLFGGGSSQNVGEIDGIEISAKDFNDKINQEIQNFEKQNQDVSVNEEIKASIRENVWNEIVNKQVLGSQYSELGVVVSSAELFDMIQGSNPHPQLLQVPLFQENGVFSSTRVLRYLKSLETAEEKEKENWLRFEQGIENERIAQKYNNLLAKGMYVTRSMAKRIYTEQNENRGIKFVAKRYSAVNDSTITVSEEELKAYYEEHKNEYKQDASRVMDYMRFDVVPSDLDIAEAQAWIDKVAEEFKTTENDSSYVVFNSDEPLDEALYGKGSLPSNLDSIMFNSEKGIVVGPYEELDKFVVAKLSAIEMIPDSVKARHILLKVTQPRDSTAYVKLDSIKTLVQSGLVDFADIAKDVSEDVGSAIEGGDLGWFKEGTMVPPFNDACFNGETGDMVIIQSQFGFHLIEVLDQGEEVKKVQIAKVVRLIEPSSETFSKVYAEVGTFYSENNTTEKFEKVIEDGKTVNVEVKVGDKTIPGLESPREMIRWAFNNEKGAISPDPFQFGNSFVVVHLTEVKEEGVATMEQIALQVEAGAKKQKKATMFKEEMEGIHDLDELAEKIGTTVEAANNVNFAAYSVPEMGQEPQVVGVASTLQQGEMSTPVEGKTGVFVIYIEGKTPAKETEDYSFVKIQAEQQYAGKSNQMFDALKDKFGVVDARYKFY